MIVIKLLKKMLRILLIIVFLKLNLICFSQNSNISNLLTESQWNSLFPKRAGTLANHPQGYSSDFFSFNSFSQAINEMSDYLVNIRLKTGVWGQLITITKKSSGQSYIYLNVDSLWHSNTTPETIINVDFEHFINRNSAINNKRELGAFLANISKETTGGWQLPVGNNSEGDYAKWGLYFVHELGYTNTNSAGTYSTPHAEYPPNPTVGYYGRGPIQLSWNYNYGQFSKFLYNDISILLNNPNLIQQNSVLAFKSAIWFWMMPQCPKPSCHQVMHDLFTPSSGAYSSIKMNKKGFLHTNNIINGGLECRTNSSTDFTAKVILRSELYKYYLSILGLNSNQINNENTGDYSTLCFESNTNAMQDYINCSITETLNSSEFEASKLSIFPNPVNNILYVNHSTKIEKLELFNSLGQLVFSSKYNSDKIELNVNEYSSGLYLIKFYSDNNIYTQRIFINK
jgi:basic endochitinase B